MVTSIFSYRMSQASRSAIHSLSSAASVAHPGRSQIEGKLHFSSSLTPYTPPSPPSHRSPTHPTLHKTPSTSPTSQAPRAVRPETKLTIAEQDALLFRQLDDREGSGAGNEIVDGEYEKGMTKYTRANQFRVI